jgi:signal transduction histidine kinase
LLPEIPLATGRRGIPLRWMLVFTLSVVVVCLTAVSLRIVDARLHQRIAEASQLELRQSLSTFADAESERQVELQREDALLADLPSLKALMTTGDDRTIQDGGQQFWKTSGDDLFALALKDGHVSAAYTRGKPASDVLRHDLEQALTLEERGYLVSGHRLFGYSVKPLFFGDERSGTLLGYVITGYAIDAQQLGRLANASGLQLVFLSGQQTLASTLTMDQTQLVETRRGIQPPLERVTLAGEPFAAVARDLSSQSTAPLTLLLLRSLRRDEAQTREIDRLLALVAIFTGLAGAGLMLIVANGLTRSLRALSQVVEAFGRGDPDVRLPEGGPREVLQLSSAFAAMRRQIEDTNRALLEAERLATIGRMARSVSHDLRHYLSAVYANAEFLATDRLTPQERSEFLEEIRLAVLGTTDMIDSLIIFSRTGQPAPRRLQDIDPILRRASDVVERHAEVVGVRLEVQTEPGLAFACCDSTQIERALCNLMLNASQAARQFAADPCVRVRLILEEDYVVVRIEDNGSGVPEGVRSSVFQPFVSEGKQNGTGLGLTFAFQVAQDHGGSISIERSSPGDTCFRFSISRVKMTPFEPPVDNSVADSAAAWGGSLDA